MGSYIDLTARRQIQLIKGRLDAIEDGGEDAGDYVVLDESGALPAVDGSQLTDLVASQIGGLGTAATADTGVDEGDVVVLDATGLPAVDGSQLTGLDASQLDYTPGTGGDWDGPPAKVDEALDEVGGRLTALEVPRLAGRINYVELPAGGSILTVSVGGNVVATLTMSNLAGGNTARTGAGAATVDIGGGAGDAADALMGEIQYALMLLIDADAIPIDMPIPYSASGGGGTPSGLRISAQTDALVLAFDDDGLTLVNP